LGSEHSTRDEVAPDLPLSQKRRNYVRFPNILGVADHLNDRYWVCFKRHDNMYGIHRGERFPEITTRREADRRMHACLLAKGCPRPLATLIYATVRCFGGFFWR
jgi:hypothetical protein